MCWPVACKAIFRLSRGLQDDVFSSPAASPSAAQNSTAPPPGNPATPSTTLANGANGTVSLPGSALPFSSGSILPARPNLPDDPVIPHNGFTTLEEGEKAFMHLLRKAGVDADWSWDQTMRAIITDPLYKALNTLAEKKTAWQKVSVHVPGSDSSLSLYPSSMEY